MANGETPARRSRAPRAVEEELVRPTEGKDRAASRLRELVDLAVCPCCGSDMVQPLDWAPVGQSWSVALRCPECEWHSEGTYDQDVIDRYDEVMDAGIQAVLDDLELLTRANREDEIDRFAAALEADLIHPEDF